MGVKNQRDQARERGQAHREEAFIRAARRATAGLTDAHVMVGILDANNEAARWEFCLQIGHCLTSGKPLLLIMPEGAEIPEKLRLAAAAVETYRVGDVNSLQQATERALAAGGIARVH